MPIYVYRCRACQKPQEVFQHLPKPQKKIECPCGHKAERDFTLECTRKDRGKAWEWNGGEPLTLEHCGDEPKTFQNQGELRNFMREQGWKSGALL